ncbi:hypothetical protein BO71DRAFT_421566 [Aspergillus ellipticus CBS 707.79]|uniref:Aminoglycoside phosphotransferase domain-containing protein n=1 Tax=Aspergillus ellipticus CBS 707.79 TaxID=1448320 RepID=A0A319D2X8_9EURO|nr:hypothetical protein BO71DRAFT_421566 [Aspergillus ellipticus CBS 707.79]
MKNYSVTTRKFWGSLQHRTLRFRFRKLENQQHASASTKHGQKSNVTLHDGFFRYTSGRWINVVSAASGRSISDLNPFSKLSEGGFNRIFKATFSDGKYVITRLPYPSTVPEHYAVVSEAATLDYLRLHGIRTPEVYGWCSIKANPVGTEYIIIEKLDGTPLGDKYLYYTKNLLSESRIQLADPNNTVFYPWLLLINIFRAAGERELAWTKAYAKPRLPFNRLYRKIYYLKYSSIFLLGIITRILTHFQNYNNPESEMLKQPELAFSLNYNSLSLPELIYFLYIALTKRLNKDYYNTIFNQSVILRQRLFKNTEIRSILRVNILGWVLNSDYDTVKGVAYNIKTRILKTAETSEDVISVRDYFPFNDFDEVA